MKQKELRSIIEKGIEELEAIADVKWQENRFKLSKQKFITAIYKSITNNIPLWEAANYGNSGSHSRAMRKIAINIQNRPVRIHWPMYILRLAEYKKCNICESIKHLQEFDSRSDTLDNKQSKCRVCVAEDWKNNKEDKTIKQLNRRKETILHIINIMKKHGKLIECEICGYKENWAALEFHHINSKLERPEWSYTKKGKKRKPSAYILGCSKYLAEERYLKEIDNLQLLCNNCHTKQHSTSTVDNTMGLKLVLDILRIKYKCDICEETEHLHLHHNKPKEKSLSFSYFSRQNKSRILNEGLLEKEMTKDTSILCGNHHTEIHNTNLKLPGYIL